MASSSTHGPLTEAQVEAWFEEDNDKGRFEQFVESLLMDREVTFAVCRILCLAVLETKLQALCNPLGDFVRKSLDCGGVQWRGNHDDDDRVINLYATPSPATPTFRDVFQPTTDGAGSFCLGEKEAQMIVGLIAFVVTGVTCDPIKKNDNQGTWCYQCQGLGMGVECRELVEGFVEDDWLVEYPVCSSCYAQGQKCTWPEME